MSIGNESTASRRFEAHRPFFGSKYASITTPAWQQHRARSSLIMVVAILAFTAVMGALFMAVQGLFIHGSGGSGDSARMINRY